jgi:hypothetical protein
MKNILYSVALFAASPVVLADDSKPFVPAVSIEMAELDQTIKQFQASVSAQIAAEIRQTVQDNIRHSLSR